MKRKVYYIMKVQRKFTDEDYVTQVKMKNLQEN